MKKTIVLSLFLTVMLLFSGCDLYAYHAPQHESAETNGEDYVRAVWLPYYDLQKLTQNHTESAFSDSVNKMLESLNNMGFNTLTVQVRPCADAFYISNYFPCSKYCFGEQGSAMPYDPLMLICRAAETYNIRIEAWINPYRVSQDNNIDALCETNTAKKWYDDASMKQNVYIGDNTIYFNPAGEGVEDLIVSGVSEIVSNYRVSAIHFDDYFYPTTASSIDSEAYQHYLDSGGTMSLSDFRRETVTHMIKAVYTAVKSINPDVRFGISPAANIHKDYEELYADVERWATEESCCDYIVPQVYFGFQNTVMPFMQTVRKWETMTQCDLYVGLPLYKAGKTDIYAGDDGSEAAAEFVTHHDIIARQITYLSKIGNIKGYYIFSYGCLTEDDCAEEVNNMLQVMPDSSQTLRRTM